MAHFKVLRDTFAVIWMLVIIGGLVYHFFPAGYAYAAYHSGFLPVTVRIKESSPGLWFDYQESLLARAGEQLDRNRQRLSENRALLQKEAATYQEKAEQARRLLTKAKALYQTTPEAESFSFIGKAYTPGNFSAQIVVLKGQLDAANQSVEALDQARVKLDETWMTVAKKTAQVSADQTRLATARILWDTKRILGSLELDLDLGEIDQISQHDIRTLEELINDAAKVPASQPRVAQAQGKQMTDEALAILQNL